MHLQLPGLEKPIPIPEDIARYLHRYESTLVVKDFGDRLILQRKRHWDGQYFDAVEVWK